MMKFVFVLCVAVALMQQTQAFKVVTIHKGTPPAAAASAPAAPAFDPSALLQGVQSAIAGKLQQVQALVGSLVQQKTALKQNALNSLQSTLGGVKSQVGSLAGSVQPPFVIRKQIYVGAPPKPAPAPAPESTTTADVDATTTSG
ncbi:hypothetical protein FF38_06412 [Lucilia cuprina]|uniref:Uncharacterized protein n=1 Tax=Lucilia cuprina TaxID=7375 RepID=A0A0L0CBJ9_LUCCU|nr:hypothetical protein CVS40_7289 [Lucilia cuprina]KAI8121713.1 hypothetical protein CVS40_7289 [Lucilia cuprina]KNC28839.1 hypothetical protein FF38_06412 [Lucilia cuprina]